MLAAKAASHFARAVRRGTELLAARTFVFDVADRIVVLYVGRRTATFEQRETTAREVVSAVVGLEEA